jgi:hypothetical protein
VLNLCLDFGIWNLVLNLFGFRLDFGFWILVLNLCLDFGIWILEFVQARVNAVSS